MYLDKLKLAGRHAVVTGAGQGIGLACAEALAEAGAYVVAAAEKRFAIARVDLRDASWCSPAASPMRGQRK